MKRKTIIIIGLTLVLALFPAWTPAGWAARVTDPGADADKTKAVDPEYLAPPVDPAAAGVIDLTPLDQIKPKPGQGPQKPDKKLEVAPRRL
ncbi:MAG: hypothetical protein AB1641_15770 [Thermodesulfobacteriota bacterium]